MCEARQGSHSLFILLRHVSLLPALIGHTYTTSLEPVVEELDVRLRKIENMVSLLCDKVGMAHEAALPPGKRRRPDPEVTAPPCGSRGSEDLEEELENALHALSQRQGGETASDKLQNLEEQVVFLSELANIAMQTLFAPQIEEAVLGQDLEMGRTKFREAPTYGLISDGIEMWKGFAWRCLPILTKNDLLFEVLQFVACSLPPCLCECMQRAFKFFL